MTNTDQRYGFYVTCVAACTRNYKKWITSDHGSNYGRAVSIIAPGEDIMSAKIASAGSPSSYTTMSGTGIASPFVAGIMAIFGMYCHFILLSPYPSCEMNADSVWEVGFEENINNATTSRDRLMQNIIPDIVEGFDDGQTPNKFVNSGIGNSNRRANLPYAGAPEKPTPNIKGQIPTSTVICKSL